MCEGWYTCLLLRLGATHPSFSAHTGDEAPVLPCRPGSPPHLREDPHSAHSLAHGSLRPLVGFEPRDPANQHAIY